MLLLHFYLIYKREPENEIQVNFMAGGFRQTYYSGKILVERHFLAAKYEM